MAERERWRSVVVGVLAALMALGAVAIVLGPLQGSNAAVASHELPWWAFVPLFAAAELLVVHLVVRRESISISFAEIPLLLGLAFCVPAGHVLASVLGAAVGLLWQRRLGLELPFNLCLFALEAALAQALYHAVLAGGDPIGGRGIAAALLTILVGHLVSATALTAVIFITSGRVDGGVITEAMTSALAAALANSSVGLLVVVLVVTRPEALILLLAVVVTLALAYRGYSSLSRGHARLDALYRFTDGVGDAVRTDEVAAAVLAQACDVVGAETAELIVLPRGSTPAAHLRLAAGQVIRLDTDGEMTAWWAPAAAGRPVLHRQDGVVGDGPRDGLAAPLRVDDTVVGVLLVINRPTHLEPFGDADLPLFTSLANHAGLSLHKAELVDQLAAEAAAQEHRSLHDPLTGLPNRRHFLRLLRSRLSTQPRVAVAMLDIDGFSDINDAFGHDVGDQLLSEIGRRLVEAVGSDSVARLGNDEFAVLVPRADEDVDASAVASALIDACCATFAIHGVTVDVRVSAGLALAPAHGDDASTLLQHADSALYTAKQQRRDITVYDAAADGASQRLRMTADLRDAIAAGQLQVHYQPKADPVTGLPLGAEALVRWTHAEYGRVSPDEFIPLAEQTGLIRPLTAHVLDVALAACARWRRDGHPLGVAVNLSTRSLADTTLVRAVSDALDRAGVAPEMLTLEITETAVMQDLGRSVAVLRDLRALGVRLSVDDFGTGQSSLAYLKQLPIHEVKIDKSFVLAMTADVGDAAIVRAAVDVAHALGLTVVAEGVEDSATQAHLAALGCERVQGYHISRPLPLDDFEVWLLSRPSSTATEAAGTPALVR